MSVAQPRRERVEMLRRYLDGFQVVGLFVNDRAPTDVDVAGDYVELAGGGYGALMVQGAEWVVAEDAALGLALAEGPEQVFQFNAPTDPVYGYFVRDAIGGRHLWAERWEDADGRPTPIRPDLPGFEIRVVPRLAAAPRPGA